MSSAWPPVVLQLRCNPALSSRTFGVRGPGIPSNHPACSVHLVPPEIAHSHRVHVSVDVQGLVAETRRIGLRRTLEALPEGIDETYDNAMLRIRSQGRASVECATQVLSWVIFAQRPMTIEELRCAMAVESEDSDLVEEALPDSDSLLSACCGLVVVDANRNIVRLIHYTTQEYFERTRHAHFPSAQRYMTDVCITYLSFQTFSSGPCYDLIEPYYDNADGGLFFRQRLKKNTLLSYAAEHWGSHAREALKHDPTTNGVVTQFLSRKANVSSSIEAAFYLGGNIKGDIFRVFEPSPIDFTELHVAATFGFQNLAQTLLEQGVDVHARDFARRTALHMASANGHASIVRLLLDNGANLDTKDRG